MIILTCVKICGIRREEDINFLNEVLPEYAGLVFCKSKRQISIEDGRKLVKSLNKNVIKVGVFQNQSVDEVNYIANILNLDVVQLHGEEDHDFISKVECKNIWKSLSIDINDNCLDFYRNKIEKIYKSGVQKLLLDSSVKGTSGGNGIGFNWNMVKRLNLNKPFVLAGGLNSKNICKAINLTNPDVVDVSSGVEENGFKNLEKIKKFIEKVRNYNER